VEADKHQGEEDLALQAVSLTSTFTSRERKTSPATKLPGAKAIAVLALAFLALVACLYAIYSPVYQYQYAFADDYFCLLEKLRNPLWVEAHNAQYFLQGRFLCSLFFVPEMWNVAKIVDFVPLRVLGVLYISLCSFCFYLALRRVNWTAWQSFAGALCLGVTAGLQVHATWAIASHQVLAIVFAYLSWHFLNSVSAPASLGTAKNVGDTFGMNVRESEGGSSGLDTSKDGGAPNRLDTPQDGGAPNRLDTSKGGGIFERLNWIGIVAGANRIRLLLSFIFMFAAAAIYQPAAMFFWVFAAVTLTADAGSFSDRLRFFFLSLLVCGLALAADFGTFFLAKQYYGAAALLSGRSHLTDDPVGKLRWFINGPLVDAFNFFRLVPSRSLALKSAILIGLGLVLNFSGTLKRRIVLLTCMAALVPLSYLPNLLVAENFASYRSEIALLALTTLFLLVALRGVLPKISCRGRVFTVAASGLAVAFSLTAYCNLLNFFAVPQALELTLLRQQCAGMFGRHQVWHPFMFTREETLAPFVRYDEFGMPSSAQTFARLPMQVLLKLESAEPKSDNSATQH
jgi:hypothetical protein